MTYGKVTLEECEARLRAEQHSDADARTKAGEHGGADGHAENTVWTSKGTPFREGSAGTLQVICLKEAEYEKAAGAGMEVTVRVRNESGMELSEVLQVYVRVEGSANEVKNHRLCAFQRIFLKPGERRDAALMIRTEAFETVDGQGARHADGGGAKLFIGFGQPDERTAELLGYATRN